jgi:hypothetical protein
MLESFSQRIGAVKRPEVFQKESATPLLRTDLWNVWYARYWHHEHRDSYFAVNDDYLDFLWTQVLHGELSLLHDSGFGDVLEAIHRKWFDGPWHFCYDVIDATLIHETSETDQDDFTQAVNDVLQSDLSAYRIVGNRVVPMTADIEIQSVEAALATPIGAVQEHLNRALTHMSDRENPDYRNSIKESISAVEAICTTIVGMPHASLGDALARIETKVSIHAAQKEAFQKLYGYTSDAEGIRHALSGEATLTGDDAKFMLVSCSAFIEFLVSKADQAGIDLGKSAG